MDKIFDRNTLYIYSYNITDDELLSIVKNNVQKAEQFFNKKIKCDYRSNIIKIYDSENGKYISSGKGYLFVSNPVVYNLLLEDYSGLYKKKKISGGEGWLAEDSESGDDLDINEFALDLTITGEPGEEKKRISIKSAELNRQDQNIKHNVLYCKNFTDVNEKELYEIFNFYNTSAKKYPKININQRSIFVEYDPDTHDAEFALCMTKKLRLRDLTLTFKLSERK